MMAEIHRKDDLLADLQAAIRKNLMEQGLADIDTLVEGIRARLKERLAVIVQATLERSFSISRGRDEITITVNLKAPEK
jgi:hypothetical protein